MPARSLTFSGLDCGTEWYSKTETRNCESSGTRDKDSKLLAGKTKQPRYRNAKRQISDLLHQSIDRAGFNHFQDSLKFMLQNLASTRITMNLAKMFPFRALKTISTLNLADLPDGPVPKTSVNQHAN